MYNILITDQEGKVVEEKKGVPNFLLNYTISDGTINQVDHLLYAKFDNNKNIVTGSYREILEGLSEVYNDRLGWLNTDKILIISDEVWEPTEKSSVNSKWKYKITKNQKSSRVFNGYNYVIELRNHYLEGWSDNQLHAVLLEALLRIDDEDGSIRKYSPEDKGVMIATLGANWLEENANITVDVLEGELELKTLKEVAKVDDGQVTIEDIQEVEDGE